MPDPRPSPSPTPPPLFPPEDSPFHYLHTESFAAVLHELGASLLVTTYQAGKLMVVRPSPRGLSLLLRSFEQPMGLAMDGDRLIVGTRNQVWTLRNSPEIAPQLEPLGTHDACYVPRESHVTGDIRGHEIAFLDGRTWIVNTRFSCLCTLEPDYSFTPRWRPPFVSSLAAEDRCHLNGLCVVDGRVEYVTALGRSDAAEGWRERKADGGVVIHVPSNEIVADGLSMPHSPRFHRGKLWLLNSGEGLLQTLDPATGKRADVQRVPGYARGLALSGKYAFIGLSQIREKKQFGGLPVEQHFGDKLQSGVWCIDLDTGQIAGHMAFQAGVQEIFDVQLMPSLRHPGVIGLNKPTLNGVFVLPREAFKS